MFKADLTKYQKWQESTYTTDLDTTKRVDAILKNAPMIAIVGDYDVDGIDATYITAHIFKAAIDICIFH